MTAERKLKPESLLIRDPEFKLFSAMPKPEFMLVGSAKSGTTSFSSYLPLHPQVRECIPKEPNYWSWKLCDRKSYQSLFVNAQPLNHPGASQQISGEYSTSYLPHPLVPRRVKARLPQVKIIILLRNPIDRAYSHYMMARREGEERECSFEEVIDREMEEVPSLLDAHRRGFLDTNFRTAAHRCMPDGSAIRVGEHTQNSNLYPLDSERALFRYYVTSCLFRSIYCDQVWRWQLLFPPEQIKIIESGRLLNDRGSVLDEVTHFLGLQSFDYAPGLISHTWGGGSNRHNTPGEYKPMSPGTRSRLEIFFRPYNESLFTRIKERYDWK